MPRARFAKRKKIVVDESNPCPLLQKLPVEIRVIIWHYLLAGQLIHTGRGAVCSHELDVWEQYELSKALNSSEAIDRHPEVHDLLLLLTEPNNSVLNDTIRKEQIRHRWRNDKVTHIKSCISPPYVIFDESFHPSIPTTLPRRPQTRILRTCRKIYHETHDIFWSGNTFAFDGNPNHFHDFVTDHLTTIQRKLITKIHFSYSDTTLTQRFRREILAELTSLREFHLTLNFDFIYRDSNNPSAGVTVDRASLTPFFTWFQCLGLERVGVVVSTDAKHEDKLTFEEAVNIAEEVRGMILPKRVSAAADSGREGSSQIIKKNEKKKMKTNASAGQGGTLPALSSSSSSSKKSWHAQRPQGRKPKRKLI